MYQSECKAYKRHDSTATQRLIKLNEKYWSLIEVTQIELAKELGVPRVSRPVALCHILDEALKHGICRTQIKP